MSDLLLDTNVLLLLVVGSFERGAVSRNKRTAQFSEADFDLLNRERLKYSRTVTTPGILTEVSDLLPESWHRTLGGHMVSLYGDFIEQSAGKEIVTKDPVFVRLGYADAMILTLATENITVMTDDVQLYLELEYRGSTVINFNHLRTYASGG